MKPKALFKAFATLFSVVVLVLSANAQNYNNIVNYYYNGTPTNGLKITTNLPFTTSSQMPTIVIHGYNYGGNGYGGPGAIDLTITYYIYDSGTGPQFIHCSVATSGVYGPPVQLSNESGKVVIFINDKPYCPRFTVSAFAQGFPQDIAANYTGWTVTDAALTGTNTATLPYINTFPGQVNLPGGGIINSSGALGIGTNNPYTYMLAVNGGVIATAVTVKLKANWPDYVFRNDYHLPSLEDVKTYIDQNHHLPDMPSAAEVQQNGLNLGEINKQLTKKVEELTLYLIEKEKTDQQQQSTIDDLKQQVKRLAEKIDALEKK